MRATIALLGITLLAGCAGNRNYYSPYDVNRDGVMDFVCPGMEYDPTRNTNYGWRSKGSKACRKQASG